MRNIIRFLYKNHVFILFLFLEIVSFILISNYNSYQRSVIGNKLSKVTYKYNSKVNQYTSYIGLNSKNSELVVENSYLHELVYNTFQDVSIDTSSFRYSVIAAKVTNNTTNKSKNFITLNRGKNDSIKVNMAVFGPLGVIGKIVDVSDNFSLAISLVNTDFRLSAKVKKNEYFGSLFWEGNDYSLVKLQEIPLHVDLQKGDTIVTSGFSDTFPEGIMVGVVENIERADRNFLETDVRLSTDFKNISNVYIIIDKRTDEIETLEEGYYD